MSASLTPALLQAATGCPAEAAETFAPHLAAACAHYQIDTPERLTEFLAQLGHESGGLRYVREVADGSAYEGRVDLGNTEPGDGRRFRGRGLIQVTGRSNYGRMSVLLVGRGAPDFTAEPEAMERPEWAAWSAAAYWADAELNDLADAGMTVKIGRRINRGNANSQREANGEADRLRRREIAARAIVAAIDQIGTGSPIEPEPMPPQPELPRDAPGASFPFPDSNRPERYAPAGEADPVAEDPSYRQPDTQEAPMPAPLLKAINFGASLIGALAGDLISGFAPLAQEKLAERLGKHSSPAVAEQVATAMIDTVKAATGRSDPIAAVAAAKASPAIVQQAEDSALATLDRLAPLLDKLAQGDRQAWDAEESSRDAAARRAAGDPNDQDAYLTMAIVRIVIGLLVVCAMLIATAMVTKSPELNALIVFFTTIGGGVAAKFGTRYDHRYGSSRGNSVKDVVIGELARRPKGQQP